jgi:hypothetical protein
VSRYETFWTDMSDYDAQVVRRQIL